MVNLLNTNELYGERVTTFDLKLSKNVRFSNKRVAVGVDVYNLFNSDAIQDSSTPTRATTRRHLRTRTCGAIRSTSSPALRSLVRAVLLPDC